MAYTTIDDPSGIFTANLYSGNATNGTTISTGHTSDLIWTKGRAGTYGGRGLRIIDSVRGATKVLYGDQDLAEGTNNSSSGVTGFGSTDYTIGGDADFNGASSTYVSWTWKIQAGVCDIQTYTGNGSARTISHNLGVVPKMMIIKKRNTAAPWSVGHASLAANQVLELNETDTVATDDTYWNNTRPTSSVFTVGTDGNQNTDGHTYLIYLFGNKQGVSKMGNYTGNANADGEFIYTGFKPRWIMIKGTNIARNWGINDTKRSPINQTQDSLYANVADAETASGNYIDFLSNGFKLRDTALTMNGAYNYIYMAFAENPFVTSTGVPATAR